MVKKLVLLRGNEIRSEHGGMQTSEYIHQKSIIPKDISQAPEAWEQASLIPITSILLVVFTNHP
jgi:hypothetical protein